jgi:hypothetical protein
MKPAGAVNMGEAIKQIDLTSALTLTAFGVELSGENFAGELNARHFGLEKNQAFKQLAAALEELQNRVVAGDLTLYGKFVASSQAPGAIEAEQIDPHALLSFSAFDYQINGLRFGERHLLWFSESDEPYRMPIFARLDYYRDVTVARGQIRKFLGTGASPYRETTTNTPLTDQGLAKWFEALSPEQQALPQQKLYKLANEELPGRGITVRRIREITKGRKPGPRKNRTIKK